MKKGKAPPPQSKKHKVVGQVYNKDTGTWANMDQGLLSSHCKKSRLQMSHAILLDYNKVLLWVPLFQYLPSSGWNSLLLFPFFVVEKTVVR
jgi:hypothetical protein